MVSVPGSATFEVLAGELATPLFSARLDPTQDPSQRHWFTAEVDLRRYSGRPLTLTFQTTTEPIEGRVAVSVPVWGNPTLLVDAAERSAKR